MQSDTNFIKYMRNNAIIALILASLALLKPLFGIKPFPENALIHVVFFVAVIAWGIWWIIGLSRRLCGDA